MVGVCLGSTVAGASREKLTMHRTIGFFVVIGMFWGGGIVCWRLRRRRRSLTAPVGPSDVTDRFSDTVDEDARWEDEGGAVLAQ